MSELDVVKGDWVLCKKTGEVRTVEDIEPDEPRFFCVLYADNGRTKITGRWYKTAELEELD